VCVGCGLGKNENGLSEAIKPTIKADTCGFGFDQSKDFSDDWWTLLFNKSAEKITVTKGNSSSELCVAMNSDDRREERKQCQNRLYTRFVKSNETESRSHKADTPMGQTIPDDQLFIACGGRTAHRAARHGLNLTGKLKRLAKQEQQVEKDGQDEQSKKRFRQDIECSQGQGQLELAAFMENDSDSKLKSSKHDRGRKKGTKHRQ
jgi:hypothetical protein